MCFGSFRCLFFYKLTKIQSRSLYYTEIIKQDARETKLIISHFPLLINLVHLYYVSKQKRALLQLLFSVKAKLNNTKKNTIETFTPF